jgi:hypothetical protein
MDAAVTDEGYTRRRSGYGYQGTGGAAGDAKIATLHVSATIQTNLNTVNFNAAAGTFFPAEQLVM